MPVTETPVEEALKNNGLKFILAHGHPKAPSTLQVRGNSLVWTEPGSSAQQEGNVAYEVHLTPAQKTAMAAVGIPEAGK